MHFHICPQEIMAFLMAWDSLKGLTPMVGIWCKSCLDGTHKSCEDHVVSKSEGILPQPK